MDDSGALKMVREFKQLLVRSRSAYGAAHPSGLGITDLVGMSAGQKAYDQVEPLIREKVHAIERIAQEVAPAVAPKMRQDATRGWPHLPREGATDDLIGVLAARVELAPILSVRGALETAGLHRWVWEAAERLWRDGHHPEAVQKAATRVLDVELPDKLGLPHGTSSMGQAFSLEPPTARNPRLRFRKFAADTDSWKSAHEGAKFLGMAFEQGIRNLIAHGARTPDPQVALEMLATISLLARWIEEAEVETSALDSLSEAGT